MEKGLKMVQKIIGQRLVTDWSQISQRKDTDWSQNSHRIVTDWSQTGHRLVTDWSQKWLQVVTKWLQSGHIVGNLRSCRHYSNGYILVTNWRHRFERVHIRGNVVSTIF